MSKCYQILDAKSLQCLQPQGQVLLEKFINGFAHGERKNQDELERVHERNFENPKLTRQIFVAHFW